MKKKLKGSVALLLVMTLALLSLTACAQTTPASSSAALSAAESAPASEAPSDASEASVSATDDSWVFTDSTGREVEIPTTITKVAPSGAFTQMLMLALAPDMMVSIASPFSAEAQEFIGEKYYNLPVVGQFYGSADLNLEEIAAIGPHVVIDMGETKNSAVEDMDSITDSIAVPAVHIEATTETMGNAFRTLGKILGREAKAEVLAAYCEETLADIYTIMDDVGEENKVNLLYCLGDAGLNVIAKDSFHSEIIDIMVNNVAVVDEPSSKGTGNEVNLEQLLLWNPEIILFAPDSIYATAGDDAAWQQMRAIQNGTYYEVPFGPYNWMGFPPSVNRYLGMLWTAKLFYPEQADYDLYEKVAEYFELFYHCKLTQEQFDKLTAHSLVSA